MNWEAIGAAGEIAGALAVVATLFYLARQVSQHSAALDRANDYARATTIHNTDVFHADVFATLAKDGELASIYARALNGEELDQAEAVRFTAFITMYLDCFEDIYNQAILELGFEPLSDSDGFERELRGLSGPYIRRLISTPAGTEWWERDAPHQFQAGIRAVIQTMLDVR